MYPCKDCLILVKCEDPCNKAKTVCFNDKYICTFCGSPMTRYNCSVCDSNMKVFKNCLSLNKSIITVSQNII